FFSSRRRHTRWPRDWSSDVCSSDLNQGGKPYFVHSTRTQPYAAALCDLLGTDQRSMVDLGQDGETNGAAIYAKIKQKTPRSGTRSEERRVGKECRTRRVREC